jgi:hypothetical protein
MKHINGAYIDNIDVLTTEIPYYGSESISARINRNYKFSIDNSCINLYLIRIHVSYVQTFLYNPADFFNSLFFKIESLGYNNKRDHIVFTMQEEGTEYFNKVIYKLIKEIRPDYDLSNICYADEKLNISNSDDSLKYLNFVHQCNSIRPQKIEHNIKKDKIFLTFNRRHKIHRTMLVGRLIEENLIDKSFVSFYPNCEGSNFIEGLMKSDYLSMDRKHKYAQWLNKEFILDQTIDAINENTNLAESAKLIELHKRSLISVICETKFDENEISVTEKTYKAIAYKHPFIIIGPSSFLRYVNELGYKTFHPYIDESYDDIKDPMKRFEAVISELKRLAALSKSDLSIFQKNITEITNYNHSIHNKNFDYLDNKTTLFQYINQFDSNVQNIVDESKKGGGILKLRKKF